MTDHHEPTYGLLAEPAAEVAVLGAILRLGQLPADVEATLEPEDFADPHRGAVYAAMVQLSRNGKPTDVPSVLSVLEPGAKRAMNNGLQLIEFMEMAPVGGASYHAEVVATTAERQRYVSAGMRVAQLAREGGDGYADLVRAAVDGVPRGGKHKQRDAWEVLSEILDPQVEAPGIRYGLIDLDESLNPMQPGAITAIGARSGVGKTTFGLDILRRAAYQESKRALFISIEMTDREVFTKLLSAEARVNHHKILMGEALTSQEDRRVAEAANRIGGGSLVVADVDSLSLADFRQLVREFKPELVAIDFLGMCTFPKADRHELAISDFVYGVKRVSAEEQCHTIILSQFNRAADQRTDKKPTMGDFKDSAALEHAAHLALLLDRPDLRDPEEYPGEVHVYVGKQRNGATGFTIHLAAQLHYSQFMSMAAQAKPWQQDPAVDITEPTRTAS